MVVCPPLGVRGLVLPLPNQPDGQAGVPALENPMAFPCGASTPAGIGVAGLLYLVPSTRGFRP